MHPFFSLELVLISETMDRESLSCFCCPRFYCIKWYCLLPLCRTREGLLRSSCSMWRAWLASPSTCPSRDVHWDYAVMSNQRWEDMLIVHQATGGTSLYLPYFFD